MDSQYYSMEVDVRVVIINTTEVIIQKMNSMSMDSKCVILKSERCIELIKYLMSSHSYSEIKQYFNTDIPNLNDIMMTLLKYNILTIGQRNVVL
ncbi:hypothetical protein DEH81_09660 [Pectobacterium zantedeschiae]|uniref:Uncharacterized protein n=1 Tax=Pectobacterium zantedeschiae TaxID=2034769 RepID=A0A9X8JHP7_9GAMM|nr:hypothetical protein DEH81_09660 [Pectobacterium zantedeschiae]RYC43626.1 hypothetical protein CLR69_00780 [Pectobacterium zantedeschiae]RYC49152.1 hypothetical protein CTN06_06835 [Pectobacterium zantedeschiae]